MTEAGLDLIDAFNGAQIEWVSGQTVERIGGHAEHFASTDLIGGILHQGHFRSLTTDFYNLGAHGAPFLSAPVSQFLFRPRNLT